MAMDDGKVIGTPARRPNCGRNRPASLDGAFIQLLLEAGGARSQHCSFHRVTAVAMLDAIRWPTAQSRALWRFHGGGTASASKSSAARFSASLGSNGCGKMTTMSADRASCCPAMAWLGCSASAVDARDPETRKQVGYMSQAFSLQRRTDGGEQPAICMPACSICRMPGAGRASAGTDARFWPDRIRRAGGGCVTKANSASGCHWPWRWRTN